MSPPVLSDLSQSVGLTSPSLPLNNLALAIDILSHQHLHYQWKNFYSDIRLTSLFLVCLPFPNAEDVTDGMDWGRTPQETMWWGKQFLFSQNLILPCFPSGFIEIWKIAEEHDHVWLTPTQLPGPSLPQLVTTTPCATQLHGGKLTPGAREMKRFLFSLWSCVFSSGRGPLLGEWQQDH